MSGILMISYAGHSYIVSGIILPLGFQFLHNWIYYAFHTNTFFILWMSQQLAKFMCAGSPAQCEKLCRESGIVMYVLGTILHVLLDKNAHSYASFL